MKKISLSVLLVFYVITGFAQSEFSFVYLPDLHLQDDSLVLSKFKQVALQLNKMGPDFVLTGGDMIYTAKNVDDGKAGQLFDLMDTQFKLFTEPVYLTMGNHETVGITQESGIDNSNPMWGKQMYEKRYNKRYYSFVYEGWKFFVLDGIKILEVEKNYTQGVDSVQISWIKDELQVTDKHVPIMISIHTPLINPHAITDPDSRALSLNSQYVLSLFNDHNLKMVLQGHNHIYMNLLINGIHYVSGGSTSYGTDPLNDGFLFVKISGNKEKSEFIYP